MIWRILRSFRILSASIPLLDCQYRTPLDALAHAAIIATRISMTRTNRFVERLAPKSWRTAGSVAELRSARRTKATETIVPSTDAGIANAATNRGTPEWPATGG